MFRELRSMFAKADAERRVLRVSICIFLFAVAIRIGIMGVTKSYLFIETSEVQSVASSLAERGTFANAYGHDSGPTAHTTPVYPLVLSVLYRVFRAGTDREIAQETFGCLIAGFIWALMPILSLACGMDPRIGIWTGVFGALLVINRWAETKGAFETGMGALFFVLLFVFYVQCWRSKNFSPGSAAFAGLLSGLAILVYAPLALVAVGLLLTGYLVCGRKSRRDYLLFASTALTLWVITLLPWAIRNRSALGGLVWTRSNFPLELSLSNNDMAKANFADNEQVMNLYHPRESLTERTRLRTIGELEYERGKRDQALHWIASHPRNFVWLTVQRFFYFWFPVMKRPLQSFLLEPITIMGLWGLVSLLSKGQLAGYGFLTILTTFPLVYYVVQSHPRYVYPVEWALVYLGVYQVFLLLKQRSQSHVSNPECKSDPAVV